MANTQDNLIMCILKLGKVHDFTLGEASGDLSSLRSFHNWVKLEMIMSAVKKTNGTKLLDIAVGRGGDLMKWSKANLQFVTGIDSDPQSIYSTVDNGGFDGAIKRYQQTKRNKKVPKSFFWKMSATDPKTLGNLNEKDKNTIYDVVSCQFAFHYFVKDIDLVLETVKTKLKVGGLFIGTASDGDLIKANLDNGDILLPSLNIISHNKEEYIYHLDAQQKDRPSYFEIKGVITEYFLYKDFFIRKAEEHSLKVVSISNFSDFFKGYDKTMSIQEKVVSFLNFAFVFERI